MKAEGYELIPSDESLRGFLNHLHVRAEESSDVAIDPPENREPTDEELGITEEFLDEMERAPLPVGWNDPVNELPQACPTESTHEECSVLAVDNVSPIAEESLPINEEPSVSAAGSVSPGAVESSQVVIEASRSVRVEAATLLNGKKKTLAMNTIRNHADSLFHIVDNFFITLDPGVASLDRSKYNATISVLELETSRKDRAGFLDKTKGTNLKTLKRENYEAVAIHFLKETGSRRYRNVRDWAAFCLRKAFVQRDEQIRTSCFSDYGLTYMEEVSDCPTMFLVIDKSKTIKVSANNCPLLSSPLS